MLVSFLFFCKLVKKREPSITPLWRHAAQRLESIHKLQILTKAEIICVSAMFDLGLSFILVNKYMVCMCVLVTGVWSDILFYFKICCHFCHTHDDISYTFSCYTHILYLSFLSRLYETTV